MAKEYSTRQAVLEFYENFPTDIDTIHPLVKFLTMCEGSDMTKLSGEIDVPNLNSRLNENTRKRLWPEEVERVQEWAQKTLSKTRYRDLPEKELDLNELVAPLYGEGTCVENPLHVSAVSRLHSSGESLAQLMTFVKLIEGETFSRLEESLDIPHLRTRVLDGQVHLKPKEAERLTDWLQSSVAHPKYNKAEVPSADDIRFLVNARTNFERELRPLTTDETNVMCAEYYSEGINHAYALVECIAYCEGKTFKDMAKELGMPNLKANLYKDDSKSLTTEHINTLQNWFDDVLAHEKYQSTPLSDVDSEKLLARRYKSDAAIENPRHLKENAQDHDINSFDGMVRLAMRSEGETPKTIRWTLGFKGIPQKVKAGAITKFSLAEANIMQDWLEECFNKDKYQLIDKPSPDTIRALLVERLKVGVDPSDLTIAGRVQSREIKR